MKVTLLPYKQKYFEQNYKKTKTTLSGKKSLCFTQYSDKSRPTLKRKRDFLTVV